MNLTESSHFLEVLGHYNIVNHKNRTPEVWIPISFDSEAREHGFFAGFSEKGSHSRLKRPTSLFLVAIASRDIGEAKTWKPAICSSNTRRAASVSLKILRFSL